MFSYRNTSILSFLIHKRPIFGAVRPVRCFVTPVRPPVILERNMPARSDTEKGTPMGPVVFTETADKN